MAPVFHPGVQNIVTYSGPQSIVTIEAVFMSGMIFALEDAW
jgi:hypothetical protein